MTAAMEKRKQVLITGLILLLILAWASCSSAQPALEYQYRGDRYEGIKAKPVSGYDIELISVMVNYREEVKEMPDEFKLKFYLEQPSEVHLTVRELDYKHYYWMDKVTPAEPWKLGFDNCFEWPTDTVLQNLEGLKMYELGVVARLGKRDPSALERVAPVIFYHSKLPSTIGGYLFTFKTNADARMTFRVYKKGRAGHVFQSIRSPHGGRPFTVRWNSSKASKGPYKLVATGYSLDTNDPINQGVHFYHQPHIE